MKLVLDILTSAFKNMHLGRYISTKSIHICSGFMCQRCYMKGDCTWYFPRSCYNHRDYEENQIIKDDDDDTNHHIP